MNLEEFWNNILIYNMNNQELWRQIDGFNLYEISTHGNVRKILKSKKTKPVKQREIGGHPTVVLCKDNKKYPRGVMKLIAFAFLKDEIEENAKQYRVFNRCEADDGNITNCRLDNLFIDYVDSNLKDLGISKKQKEWVFNTKHVTVKKRYNKTDSYWVDPFTIFYYFRGADMPSFTVNVFRRKNGNRSEKDIRFLYDRWIAGDDMDEHMQDP